MLILNQAPGCTGPGGREAWHRRGAEIPPCPWQDSSLPDWGVSCSLLRLHLSQCTELAAVWPLPGLPLGQRCCEHMFSVPEGPCHRRKLSEEPRAATRASASRLPKTTTLWSGQTALAERWERRGGRSLCGQGSSGSAVIDRRRWGAGPSRGNLGKASLSLLG